MIDNTQNPQGDQGWNSEEVVLGDLSCKKAARFMDSYMSIFRAFNMLQKDNPAEVATLLAEVMTEAVERLKNNPDKAHAEESMRMAIAASGFAAATAVGLAEPYDLANLAENAVNTVYELVSKEGPEFLNNHEIVFGVKKGATPGSMTIGTAGIPRSTFSKETQTPDTPTSDGAN